MGTGMRGLLARAQDSLHWIGIGVITALALALAVASLGAALASWPWLEMSLRWGGAAVENAGMIAQLGLTALALALLFYLPANLRILRLENSHRSFQVSMDDVARAYRASHEADRAKLFRIGSQFDSVRERFRHLRDHPDLGALEPEVLELAAQMSHGSRELADVYSDQKVARARAFLAQRQQEVETFLENLAMAKKTVADLKHWLLQIETEEGLVGGQLATLEADLMELLPLLGFELESAPEPVPVAATPERVVPMRPTREKTPSNSDRH